jgi:hypothetical protein
MSGRRIHAVLICTQVTEKGQSQKIWPQRSLTRDLTTLFLRIRECISRIEERRRKGGLFFKLKFLIQNTFSRLLKEVIFFEDEVIFCQ